jgi:hypothetical protein
MREIKTNGIVYRSEIVSVARSELYIAAADRLKGTALLRLSGSWWSGSREWRDILRCELRFVPYHTPDGDEADAQQMLFVTSPRSWMRWLSCFSTDAHDFMENDYYTASRLKVGELGELRNTQWRLVPHRARTGGRNRWQKLERAVRHDLAAFRLEALHPRKSEGQPVWEPVVEFRLTERASEAPVTPPGLDPGLRTAQATSGEAAENHGQAQANGPSASASPPRSE